MLYEIAHLLYHAPATLRLRQELPQAELYQTLMQRVDAAGMATRRRALVQSLSGTVLEVGCGTGLMFPHYDPAVRLFAIEPDAPFRAVAQSAAPAGAALLAARGEALPFADQSFDAVVMALLLCSVPDVQAVLAETRRVLRPGAPLHLIEHVRSPHRLAGALMHMLDPVWLVLNGQGCHMDRDPTAEIVNAGFTITEVERFQIFSAGLPAFPMLSIRAVCR